MADAPAEQSVTPLERRCRLLLRAYPAGYRKDRGGEIVGTLLEATAAGRSWPLARDVRALVTGGLRARAALNRRLTTAANLRTAALIGAAAYLAYGAVGNLTFFALALTWTHAVHQTHWSALLAGSLTLAAVVLAWVSRRRAVLLAVSIGAAAAIGVSLASVWPHAVLYFVTEFGCLAVLVLHTGSDERPRAGWLWPLALIAAFPVAGDLLPGVGESVFIVVVEGLALVSLLWVVIDARPAVAMSVFVLALLIPAAIWNIAVGPDIAAGLPLLIVAAVAAVAVWLLRRQSARPRARRES